MTDEIYRLRKKIRFRGLRRGTRESDLVIGGFVATCLDKLDDNQLAMLATLLEENDQDLLGWVNGIALPPPMLRNEMLQMMIEYRKNL